MANVLNANDILIGTGKLYINGQDVGQIDGEINFTHAKTFYEKKSGFPATTVVSVLTEEALNSEFNLLEANLARLRSMMSEYSAVTVTPGVSDSTEEKELQFSADKHTKLQYGDLVTLSLVSTDGTETAVTGEVVAGATGTEFTLAYIPKSVSAVYNNGVLLTEGPAADYTVVLGTGVITLKAEATAGNVTADYVTEKDVTLALNTDFYADMLAGTFYRASTSIYEPTSVDATYTYNNAASSGFGIGGASSSSSDFVVEFVHKRRDGKYRVIKLWKCQISGDFTMSFQEQAESPVAITITALADSTKAAGQQFGTVVDATSAPYGGW